MSRPPANLQRFLDAQAPVISSVMAELAAGEKRTHWMWFVFPQLAPLEETLFGEALAAFHGGQPDAATVELAGEHPAH